MAAWLPRWRTRAGDGAAERTLRANPAVIPRNHKVEEALAAATAGEIVAVAVTGKPFIFAVGADLTGVAQLDGTTATLVNTPYAPQLFGVSVDATGTAWTSGERGAVLRSADAGGTPWTTNNLAPDLLDVWTAASDNALAVGEFGFVYRWNGSSWTKVTVPTQATLTSVWTTTTGEGFIGGEAGTMLRLIGSSWVQMAFPSVSTVSALWGTNGGNVYATTKAGEIYRFNGSTWTLLTTATAPLWAVYGASAADVYAAGENGGVWRLNGAVFTALPAPATGTLSGIWLTGATNVFTDGANAAGSAGVSYRYNGTAWSTLQPGATRALTALWGPSEFDLYATGDNGTMLRFNGNTWTSMPTGTTDLLWSVSGAPNAAAGFAVGINSTIVTASGSTAFRAAVRAASEARVPGSLEPSAAARVRTSRPPNTTAISSPGSASPQTGRGASCWRTMWSLKTAGRRSSAWAAVRDRRKVKRRAGFIQVDGWTERPAGADLSAAHRGMAPGPPPGFLLKAAILCPKNATPRTARFLSQAVFFFLRPCFHVCQDFHRRRPYFRDLESHLPGGRHPRSLPQRARDCFCDQGPRPGR